MTKPAKPAKKLWPPIHEVTYSNGDTRWQVRYQINGERKSEVFRSKAEAETAAAQVRLRVENEGAAGFSLPADVRAEAARCVERLARYGEEATISAAVEHYIKTVLAYHDAPTVAEVVARLIADAKKAGRRDRTVDDLEDRLGRFVHRFGKRRLTSITLEELRAWLDDPTLSPRTRINYATKLSQLFNYAIRHDWVDSNPVEKIARPSTDDIAPDIYTPDEVARLLEHADTFGLLPYIAIALFAGLRSAELQRLDWSAVKLTERCIIIDAKVSKKRSRRVVEIGDTLAAWLATCSKPKGGLLGRCDRTLHDQCKRLAKAAGCRWKHNGLRHSFGSYFLAQTGDAVKTSFQMGNAPDVVHRFYKGLVSNGDVARYWSLRPAASEAGKIVVLKTANG
jgi:integrase